MPFLIFSAPPAGGATGSGTGALKRFGGSGSGTETDPGSGSGALKRFSGSGSGGSAIAGSGSCALKRFAGSGYGQASGRLRDRDVFADIQARLQALDEFDEILLHRPIEPGRCSADREVIAAVRRLSAAEVRINADPMIERSVDFEVQVAVREPDEETRFAEIDRLENLVCNALDGQSLAGLTMPDKTQIMREMDDTKRRNPEQRDAMRGKFAYIIAGYNAHGVTP